MQEQRCKKQVIRYLLEFVLFIRDKDRDNDGAALSFPDSLSRQPRQKNKGDEKNIISGKTH